MDQEVNPLAEEVASSRQTASLDQLDAPIPGQSLTDEPGKWAWERPARFSSVEECLDYVVNQIEGIRDSYNPKYGKGQRNRFGYNFEINSRVHRCTGTHNLCHQLRVGRGLTNVIDQTDNKHETATDQDPK